MNKIRKRPKKVIITITLILVSIFLLACTSEIKTTISESTDNNESKTPDEQVWDMGLEIYEGLKNKDKEKIKSVFSENELMNHSRKIDNKIDEVFDFIDGEIVTYKEVNGSCGGGKARDDEWVEESFVGYIYGIKTDTGREYTISYGGYLVDKDDTDNIGVSGFRITEKQPDSDESILVGTVD